MSTRKKVAVVALAAVLVGAAVWIGAAQSVDVEVQNSASAEPEVTVDDGLQACADSWNDNNSNKTSVASITTAAQAENPTAYVHVGFSSAFPDRCMITVGNPSTLYAQQYLQGGGSEWPVAPAWTGSVNALDSSNLPWNARMATDGTIIVL
ncbi:hypothetical protein ACIPSE_01420 [Streptomyces sp. NPDC090106]|uniref:hypothetical protein n=1 Tax=Streptomyces sp. NPDC090106 TaxID=3365946 RepID=UPI00382F6DA7